jgi:hypothetical protein
MRVRHRVIAAMSSRSIAQQATYPARRTGRSTDNLVADGRFKPAARCSRNSSVLGDHAPNQVCTCAARASRPATTLLGDGARGTFRFATLRAVLERLGQRSFAAHRNECRQHRQLVTSKRQRQSFFLEARHQLLQHVACVCGWKNASTKYRSAMHRRRRRLPSDRRVPSDACRASRGRQCQQLTQPVQGARGDLIDGGEFIHEAAGQCACCGIDQRAGYQQALRAIGPDDAAQRHLDTVRRDQAYLHFVQTDAIRTFGHHTVIAEQRKHGAACRAVAGNGRDNRYRRMRQCRAGAKNSRQYSRTPARSR